MNQQDHPEWYVSGDLDIGELDINNDLDLDLDLDLFLSESYDPISTGDFSEGSRSPGHTMGVESTEDSGYTFPSIQPESPLSVSHPSSGNMGTDGESIRPEGTKAPKPPRRRNAFQTMVPRTRQQNGRQPLDSEDKPGDSDQTLRDKSHRRAQKRYRERLRAISARAETEAQSRIAALETERDTLQTENLRLENRVWDYELGSVDPEKVELRAEVQSSKTSLLQQQKDIQTLQVLVGIRTRSECLLKEQSARLERIIATLVRGSGGQQRGSNEGGSLAATSDLLGPSSIVEHTMNPHSQMVETSGTTMYLATVEPGDA
jgi:hypothetical protein